MTNSKSRFLVPPPRDRRLLMTCHCSSLRVLGKWIAFFVSFTGKKRGSSAGRFQALGRPIDCGDENMISSTLVMFLRLEIVGTYPFGPNCVQSKSSYEDLKQMFTPSPTTPYLASRQTSTQTMARSAVEESSMTPMSPFPKSRLIAIPQGRWRWRSRRERKKRVLLLEVEVSCVWFKEKRF